MALPRVRVRVRQSPKGFANRPWAVYVYGIAEGNAWAQGQRPCVLGPCTCTALPKAMHGHRAKGPVFLGRVMFFELDFRNASPAGHQESGSGASDANTEVVQVETSTRMGTRSGASGGRAHDIGPWAV